MDGSVNTVNLCWLTRGTAYWKALERWCGWPGPPPPPAEEAWSASEVWPGGRWCGSGRCTSAGEWSLAGRGACCLAWSLPEHPPWNSPGSWKLNEKLSDNLLIVSRFSEWDREVDLLIRVFNWSGFCLNDSKRTRRFTVRVPFSSECLNMAADDKPSGAATIFSKRDVIRLKIKAPCCFNLH